MRNGQPCKKRTYHVVSRMGGEHDLGVFNNSVDAVECALLERYFTCKVGEEFLPPLQTRRKDWERPHLRAFLQGVVSEVKPGATPICCREVVNCYRGAKRRVYESALRSLQMKSINRKDAHLRPFTKFEKQCLLKAPRIINPRSPRYNLMLGKYLKKAEKAYFKAINKVWDSWTDHTVIKGLDVRGSAEVLRGKWDRFRDPVAVGLDASKFDMHVSVEALKYEHEFYNDVFESPELAKLLSWQLINRGKAYCDDGEVSFVTPGTRASGDLNTSLGNCLIMCSLIWAMCKKLGIVAELANNGDDCVLIFEEEHLETVLTEVPGFFHTYGFRMTVEEPVKVFEQIEFCQSSPVELVGGWTMVRNPRTCLKKDPMCLVPVQNEKVWKKWLGAVGECGVALVPGCPVLQSFYRCFERSGARAGAKFKQRIFNNTSMEERTIRGPLGSSEITPTARASFAAAFDISPQQQLDLEKFFDSQEILGFDSLLSQEGIVEVFTLPMLRHL